MKKIITNVVLSFFLTVMVSTTAHASTTQDSVGCGIGTMIFQSTNGLIWSLFALTTNTTTSGVYSTSGLLQGLPANTSTNWVTALKANPNLASTVIADSFNQGIVGTLSTVA